MSWDGKSRGNVLGHKIFVFILSKLGLNVAYFFLSFVALYFFLFVGKSRKAVYYLYKNRLGYSTLKSAIGTYRNFFSFGQSLIDKVAIMAGQKHQYKQQRHNGGQHLDQLTKEGKGAVLISGHVGNFEVGSQLLELTHGNSISVIMHDADHKKLKEYIGDVTEKKSFKIIPIKDDLSHVFEIKNALANNEFICVHGDRFMEGADVVEKEFLGEKAYFPKGPFIIATRFGAPVTFVFVFRKGKRLYEFTATAPKTYIRDIDGAINDYIARLEEVVKESPNQWFNHYPFWKK
jgi:predicted LPLAT superfamily acyltransferase